MHGRGEIAVGERFVHTSIIGSHFDSVIESRTSVGGIDAVVPSVAGQAWITDITQVGIDPTAPFPEGYTLSDTRMGPKRLRTGEYQPINTFPRRDHSFVDGHPG